MTNLKNDTSYLKISLKNRFSSKWISSSWSSPPPAATMAPLSAKVKKKNYSPVCVSYSLVCIFLFTCLYSSKALLNLILAPTCKTDYLVLICCFHRKLKFKEFSRNNSNLHFLNIYLFLWTTVICTQKKK